MARDTMEPIAFIRKQLEEVEPDLLRELLHDVAIVRDKQPEEGRGSPPPPTCLCVTVFRKDCSQDRAARPSTSAKRPDEIRVLMAPISESSASPGSADRTSRDKRDFVLRQG